MGVEEFPFEAKASRYEEEGEDAHDGDVVVSGPGVVICVFVFSAELSRGAGRRGRVISRRRVDG